MPIVVPWMTRRQSAELRARLVDAAEHAVEEIARRAERLAGGDGARGLVEHDQVREGAADVDADSLSHASAPNEAGSRIRADASEKYVGV